MPSRHVRVLRARSLQRVRGVGLGALMALAATRCSNEPAEDELEGEDAPTVSSALTTPNGSNWIVLPRPAARTNRIFADSYVAPFVASSSAGVTTTVNTTTRIEGTSSLAVTLQ